MPTQFTVSEIINLIQSDKWHMEYFLPIQSEVTARINAKLRGEDVIFQSDNEWYIYSRCCVKAEGDARELEQMVKYVGVEPHLATQIEVGAILVSSWGYDQTNVDFYVVVAMTAKMVALLPLKRITRQDAGYCSMAGTATAAKEANFRAEILKRKIQRDNWVKIESFSHASLWNGKEKYESWYA